MKISSRLLSLLAMLTFTTVFLSSCSEDPLPATSKSKIRVIHAAGDAPAVNVNVDNATAISNLQYRSASGYAEVNSGTRNITVLAPSLSAPEVFKQDLTFAENVNYTVFAVGPVTNGKISAILSTDANTPVAGKTKIRFAHMSPDAPTVDIRTSDGTSLFPNAASKTVSGYIEATPGSISLKVTTPGGATTLFEFEPVTVAAGQVFTAVAMGTVDATDNIPFSVRIYTDTEDGVGPIDLVAKSAQTAEVMLVHASPDAPAVDVLMNGTKVTTTPLAFPNSIGYLAVPVGSGNPTFALQVPNTTTVIPVPASALPTLVAGKKYTVFVTGELTKGTLDFKAVEDVFTVNATKPTLRFAHMSPDAPAVDILLEVPGMGDYPVPTLQNVKFKDVTGFVEGLAGTFPVKVRVTGTSTIALTVPSFTFTNGKVITIFANGLAAGTPALNAGVINHN